MDMIPDWTYIRLYLRVILIVLTVNIHRAAANCFNVTNKLNRKEICYAYSTDCMNRGYL